MRLLATTALCLLLSSCALKHSVSPGIDAIIPVSCVQQPIQMVGCNAELTKCRKFLVTLEKGCEQLVAK